MKSSDINKYTKNELLDVAKNMGLANTSYKNKKSLIELLIRNTNSLDSLQQMLLNPIKEVPVFQNSYSRLQDMSPQQRSFYNHLRNKLNKGICVNIEGNVGYLYVYIIQKIINWKKTGFEKLAEQLLLVANFYAHEKSFADSCFCYAYDCLLGSKQYERFLQLSTPKVSYQQNTHLSNLRINVCEHIGKMPNHLDILVMNSPRKSPVIVENNSLYNSKLEQVFEKYCNKNGGWINIINKWATKASHRRYEYFFFQGTRFNHPVLEFKIRAFYSTYEFERERNLSDEIALLSIDAENLVRDELNLPRIGEGWVSETLLFKRLEREFPETQIIQHGRPNWLGRQHYDIWFPQWRIAVEFHGKQHFEPVDFFGGEEAFIENVKRDKRKLFLSEKNNIKLFIVTENDDVLDLIRDIKEEHKIQNSSN